MGAAIPVIGDGEIADVVTFVRRAWNNEGGAVSQLQVMKSRTGAAD